MSYVKLATNNAASAFASSIYTTFTANKAFDGLTNTAWVSNQAGLPQWVGYDFGVETEARVVRILGNYPSYNPENIEIQGSSDNITWSTVLAATLENKAGFQSVIFNAVSYRYWRVYVTSVYGSTWPQIWEIEFYADTALMFDYSYSTGIEIGFDKPIKSDVEIELADVPMSVKPEFTYASSSYTTFLPELTIDGNDTTYWRSNNTLPVWLSYDFVDAKTINSIRIYKPDTYRPRAYTIKGSVDGITWVDITSGECTNATGAEIITFNSATYRFWQFYVASLYSSRCHVGEITFYVLQNEFSPNGFTVSGHQNNQSPDGTPELADFDIRKISKSVDEMSVIVWLKLADRLKYPSGPITVSYDKAIGNLAGDNSAQVESFNLSFTPQNIVPVFNPSNKEQISANISQYNSIIRIYYEEYQSAGDETITAELTHANIVIHVNDIEN